MHKTLKKHKKCPKLPLECVFFSKTCHDVLLVSSFDLTGRTPKTEIRSKSYARFRKSPLEARSWGSRNIMARCMLY
ncbi:hypothetical protein Hanom_Chr01g00044751 [Helianthus anomalus]